MMDYGAYFESMGDYETAFAIYKSISEFGAQIMNGASFSNEQLAGLDTQMAAMDAMNALAQVMDIPGGLETIQNTYGLFMQSIDIFVENTNLLDDALGRGNTEEVLRTINQILQTGDIQYLQNLVN